MSSIVGRTAAADKKPEDFAPPPQAPISKRIVAMTVTRANGDVETATLILRAGDSVALDGRVVLSLALVAKEG